MIGNTISVAVRLFVVLTLLTGVIYPLAVTGVAQSLFPRQAVGSPVERAGRVIGSDLVGQAFDDPRYFWGRPSATSPVPYNAMAGSGSNLAPSNPALVEAVQARVTALRAAHPAQTGPIPVDLVTTSASGLDPHITPAAAHFQVERVAQTRGLSTDTVRKLVASSVQGPTLGLFGQSRVNVLRLNDRLDTLKP